MKLIKVRRSKTRSHPILFIKVSRTEALELIQSLSIQMIEKSPNIGRLETYAECGTDVSIAVDPAQE